MFELAMSGQSTFSLLSSNTKISFILALVPELQLFEVPKVKK